MSTIGRIFSVLNVILAAAFLGFAATNLAAHQSWKKKHDDLNTSMGQRVADLDGKLQAAIADGQAKQNDLDTTGQALSNEKSSHLSTQESLNNERNRAAKNEARIAEIQDLLGEYKQMLDGWETARQQAETQARESIDARYAAEQARDDAIAAQTEAESQLEIATKNIADLEIKLTSEQKAHQSAQTKLASLVAATGVTLEEIGSAQPDVRGAVLQVSPDPAPGLVTINRGSNDGIKRGMTFEIFNGSTYKGTMRVDSVRETMCTGIILRAVPGVSILQGDSAATRI